MIDENGVQPSMATLQAQTRHTAVMKMESIHRGYTAGTNEKQTSSLDSNADAPSSVNHLDPAPGGQGAV